MLSLEKYEATFTETFNIGKEQLHGLEYQSIDSWDSVGHMQLISALEDAFDIMIDTDDIIDFNSFERGKEILTKYDVEF